MKKPTIARIRREVKHLDSALPENDESFKAAVVMLSMLVVGTDVPPLSMFTGYAPDFVEPLVERLQANGVVQRDGTIAANWFDENEGGIAFWMDVCVAQGLMKRA